MVREGRKLKEAEGRKEGKKRMIKWKVISSAKAKKRNEKAQLMRLPWSLRLKDIQLRLGKERKHISTKGRKKERNEERQGFISIFQLSAVKVIEQMTVHSHLS